MIIIRAMGGSFFNSSDTSPTSQLIFQPFRSFTYVTPHFPPLPLLHPHHSPFSNPLWLHLRYNWFFTPSVSSPTSQFIFHPFRCFTYHVTDHFPTIPLLYLHRSSFLTPSVASPTSQLIFQPFRCFIYVTAYFSTLLLLHLRHSSFSNPSVASPMSQLISQSFRCFTYVTAHSPTLP